MNANAYGGQLAEVLEWVDVCTAAGSDRRAPDALGFAYRSSNLGPGEVVARASFRLSPADPEEVKATLAGMRERRREAQPSGIKTFGSTFKNPEDPAAEGRTAGQLLEAAGCRGLRVGGARFSEKHANFVENEGDGDDRRRARADGRGPPPRPRAVRDRARAGGPAPGRGALAGGLGAVRRPALAAAARGRRRGRRLVLPAADDDGGADPDDRPADRGDRLRRRRDRRLPGRDAARLAGGRPRTGRCRRCRSRSPRRAAGWPAPALEQARVLGAAPAAAPPLHRGQPLRRKRGGRRAALGDRTALRRRLAGGREVALGGGGAGRSVDHGRSIM